MPRQLPYRDDPQARPWPMYREECALDLRRLCSALGRDVEEFTLEFSPPREEMCIVTLRWLPFGEGERVAEMAVTADDAECVDSKVTIRTLAGIVFLP